MDRRENASRTDLDLLEQLKPLACLSAGALRELTDGLNSANFLRHEVILPEEALAAGVHILLRGVAKITWLNQFGQRVTVALLAPGPIPEFLSLPVSRWHFRCEAHSDSRVGSMSWGQFDVITRAVSQSALRKFHETNLMQFYRFFVTGIDVRERLVFTLIQLCSNFGVLESRGTLLRIPLSHKDLADLVGASRPRITEHLAELERANLLIRQGRQLVVRLDKLGASTSARSDTNGSFANTSARPHSPKEGQQSLAAAASLKAAECEPSAYPAASPGNPSITMA